MISDPSVYTFTETEIRRAKCSSPLFRRVGPGNKSALGAQTKSKTEKASPLLGVDMISILLADDHELLLNSLASLLGQSEDIQIVAKTTNGEETITQASLYLPDVAILDISMPVMDGIEVTRQIRLYCPSTRVLILSFSDDLASVWNALEAGALGYVIKEALVTDLLPAIHALAQGNGFFSEKISGIAKRYRSTYEHVPSSPHGEASFK